MMRYSHRRWATIKNFVQRHRALSGTSTQSVEEIYQRKSPLEHVLLRPGMYIGSIEKARESLWVYDTKEGKMVQQRVEYVPALYKIFDEILVNAVDNKTRDKSMNELRVNINPGNRKNGDLPSISIYNNGRGIPITLHRDEGVYVPELVLGHLLTSSNFDDTQSRLTGGRHGYGAKLTNIFSKTFCVETGDTKAKKEYSQTWSNNMRIRQEPEITPMSSSSSHHYTRITFSPDLEKFEMKNLNEGGMLKVLEKRVFDVAGCLPPDVNVLLNGKSIPISGFESYCKAFKASLVNDSDDDVPLLFSKVNKRWEVGVLPSDNGFHQVSFVNGMATLRGGTHVNYIVDQLTRRIADHINRRVKEVNVTPAQVRPHLAVFINCSIENPTFDSQMKEFMSSKPSTYGSMCVLSEKFSKQVIANSGIVERVCNWARSKQQSELASKIKVKRNGRVQVPKLEDANMAGGKNSKECTLILTEGDSAKALAVAGLAVVGRDSYGVFPLRGKLLNVRDATLKQLSENAELGHLCTILGLNFEETYESQESRNSLRYGKVMLMTDQDHDGSHIKGLVLNLFHHFWPNLLKHDFLCEFVTPIIKAKKGSSSLPFFSIPEYQQWKNDNDASRYSIKYYKGLGTSTAEEGRSYFKNLDDHKVDFCWENELDGKNLNMAFSKKEAEARKDWIVNKYEAENYLDISSRSVNYSDFVNRELIQFSYADNERSIPSVVDGLKPSQRKVLYACFMRNLSKEIKVAQLAGFCSEKTGYHHGEMSLHSTIVNMAQNYVGSNNIPLLYPSGQFGTRLQGGKDAASARYIFTRLDPITRLVFPPSDDALLSYRDDDGFPIEPKHYVPVVPLLLVNGAEGIGTGWSTQVPTFNPTDIVDNLLLMLENEEPTEMTPWIKGFKGTVTRVEGSSKSYVVKGVATVLDSKRIEITELPAGKWVEDYKVYLQKLVKQNVIKGFTEHHTETDVHFILTLPRASKLSKCDSDGLLKALKLESKISAGNMHAFNGEGKMTKYANANEILKEFFDIRLDYYVKRKSYLENQFQRELLKLENRLRFLQEVESGELVVTSRSVSKDQLVNELRSRQYAASFEFTEDEQESKVSSSSDFDYLLNTSLVSFTKERAAALKKELLGKKAKLESVQSSTAKSLWKEDLLALKKAI